jgi:hypothetical protein
MVLFSYVHMYCTYTLSCTVTRGLDLHTYEEAVPEVNTPILGP